ncbi:Zn(2)-C6 fungal-type domain-containing protein [Mycena venus]|uniref:Zn(2)-C6 fungal-type domain-containing protein n=1 Tax=Mycena venus TaxID=2733690 RepID=A0A8H7D5W0_9AGAR|nr:Zn(2)-C6 fungal-type domain-containing protein [Mycena venus]
MPLNRKHKEQEFHQGKKNRLPRACDVCRRWKTRCDGSRMSGEKCTKCIDANLDCTYAASPLKRPPPKGGYLDLQARLEHSEKLVHQLRVELANAQFTSSSINPSNSSSASLANADVDVGKAANPSNLDATSAALHIMRRTLDGLTAPPLAPHADDLLDLEIASKFEKFSVGTMGEHAFIGKSSGASLLRAAIDLKADAKRKEESHHASSPSLGDQIRADSKEKIDPATWPSRRLQYWTSFWKQSDNTVRQRHTFKFPSDPLMHHLIELYFTRQNIYLPLLHRPTFERSVAEGLHLKDAGFGAILLLVSAIASRWSTDPSLANAGLACGWDWFDQVPLAENRFFGQATLYDLQQYCLAVIFLKGALMPQASWMLVGVGLRLAQSIGLHRRRTRVEGPSTERELYKRAFWILVYLDRMTSSVLGRTSTAKYSEFDIDPPLEVDDEYWEHATHPFQQPIGVPSRVTFFTTLMRLNHILGFSLKVLYSLKKMRVSFSINDAWEEHAITELDSALNKWREEVPDHLRWDPNPTREWDPVFFDQSVALHCAYYQLQILIHRPFIPMLRSAPWALTSLAVCTSAARACANMVDIQRRRTCVAFPLFLIWYNPVFMSGLVLLLNVWSAKRTAVLTPDPNREMANVHKCMEVMRACEHRDVLAELASVGQLQFERPIRDSEFQAPDAPSWGDADPQTFDSPFFVQSSFTPTLAPFPTENIFADLYSDPALGGLSNMVNHITADTMAAWTTAPMGLEVDDWGSYLYNFGEINYNLANDITTVDVEENLYHASS